MTRVHLSDARLQGFHNGDLRTHREREHLSSCPVCQQAFDDRIGCPSRVRQDHMCKPTHEHVLEPGRVAGSHTPPLTPSGTSGPCFQLDTRLGHRWRNRRCPRRQPQAIQDGPGRSVWMDRSEDAHRASTLRTLHHVHLEYAAHQIGPGVIARPRLWGRAPDRHGSICQGSAFRQPLLQTVRLVPPIPSQAGARPVSP